MKRNLAPSSLGHIGSLLLAGMVTLSSCRGHEQYESTAQMVTREGLRTVFRDVPASHPNYDAITFVAAHGIMQAGPDGLFHHELEVTRARILQIFMDTAGESDLPPATRAPFFDVPLSHPLVDYIARALARGIVQGYDDRPVGSRLFRPDQSVTMIEALKMLFLSNHIDIASLEPGPSFADVPPNVWYAGLARYAREHHLVDPLPDNTMGRDLHPDRGRIARLINDFFRDRPDLIPRRTPSVRR